MKILNMMMKITAAMVVIFGFAACEEDYNTIGSDIIGDNNFNAELYVADVAAEQFNIEAIQTNQLPGNLLGVYNDPVFGQKTASVLTQLSLMEYAPDFGEGTVLDSVILTIPYFSTRLSVSENGVPEYELDSVYGNGSYKLRIVLSDYFLNEFDPESDFQERKKYFSNQGDEIVDNLDETVVFKVIDDFVPSAETVMQVIGEGEDADTTYLAPRLRIELDKEFFQENIIDKEGSTELLNSNNFQNFLRGIYLQAIPNGGEGNMLLLNLDHVEAGIRLYYTEQVPNEETDDADDTIAKESALNIGFGGIKVNVLENDFVLPEDNNLYLTGGAGTLTVIDLFTEEQLEELRANNWLINEANLTFFVNQDLVTGAEPDRVYLYDLNANAPLIDYFYDVATPTGGLFPKAQHLGVLKRTSDGDGVSYKIRITDHVNQILNQDSTNVRLGLVVSPDVKLVGNTAVTGIEGIDKVPVGAALTPEGTVLYGPNAAIEEKKLQLRIYYTETE